MKIARMVVAALVSTATPLMCSAQSPDSILLASPQVFENGSPSHVDSEGRIPGPTQAGELLNLTLKQQYPTEFDTKAKDFYAVIHVVKWTDPADSKQEVLRDNWYVYHDGDWTPAAFAGKRLYGVKRFWLLYVHLNVMKERLTPCKPGAEACHYQPWYEIFVKQKLASNAANAVQLLSLFSELEADRIPVVDLWGGGPVHINTSPSDVTIQPKIQSGKEKAAIGEARTFDNEGRQWWDISFGVPLKSIKEVEIDKTAATAAPKEIDKQRLFALLNLYFPRIDLKAGGLNPMPHLVVGAAFAKKPLERILVGAGWGPVFANFYAGVVFVRNPVEVDPERKYKRQFAMGINLPVKAVAEKLKKPKE